MSLYQEWIKEELELYHNSAMTNNAFCIVIPSRDYPGRFNGYHLSLLSYHRKHPKREFGGKGTIIELILNKN